MTKRFCPKGHDTLIRGRRNGMCKQCIADYYKAYNLAGRRRDNPKECSDDLRLHAPASHPARFAVPGLKAA
jgi:hypothetical protein